MKFRAVAAGAVLCLCSSPAFAQGLSRVQLLALQQQLRDDGCGMRHVTGRMDATTRRAVRQCASKYNVSNPTPASLLSAMNIGFGPNDQMPTLSMARSGEAAGGGTAGAAGMAGMSGRNIFMNSYFGLLARDPEDRWVAGDDQNAIREKMLDKTLADSYPASDPPSTLPNPSVDSVGLIASKDLPITRVA